MISSGSMAEVSNTTNCDQTLEITFWVLNLTIGAVTLSGNIIVFAAIVTNSTLRQYPLNQFLASLAVSDIIMGACVSPTYSLFCLGCLDYPLSKYCRLMEGPKDIALSSSSLNLLVISCDRYLAVYWPLRYQTIMTSRRVVLLLGLSWGVALIVAGIRHVWTHAKQGAELDHIDSVYNVWLITLFVVIPCIIITIINIKITLAIRKQVQRMQDIALEIAHAQNETEANSPDESQVEVLRNRKGTFACVLVVMVFVVCWIPRVIFNFQYRTKGNLAAVNTLVQKLSMFFLIAQSSVNPFIYSFCRADFQSAAAKILKCNSQ